MTNNSSPRVVRHRGLTIVELSVVLTILLALTSIVFIGTRAWRRSGDRATCVLELRNVQAATRSYQNLYGYGSGGQPNMENGSQDIAEHLLARGYIENNVYRKIHGIVPCPAGGSYTCATPDVFPEPGQLYIECSLGSTAEHLPTSHADW